MDWKADFSANALGVVVIGGGLTGWLAALALRSALPPSDPVTVVSAAALPIIGVGESSTGLFTEFLARHDVDPADFIVATGATFKLGVEFVGWRRNAHAFNAPIDNPDAMTGISGRRATSIAQRAAAEDGRPVAEAYLHHWLMRQGRVPVTRDDDTVSSLGTQAWHFDAVKAAAFFERLARARGIIAIEGEVVAVVRDIHGKIICLRLRDGRSIGGDMFVDCSGQHRILMRDEPGDWHSLADRILVDRAVAGTVAADIAPDVATRAVAAAAGWIWAIPAGGRIGVGYVHAAGAIAEDTAWQALARHAGPSFRPGPTLRFEPGYRHTPWRANGVAVGMASGFCEPLQATALHLALVQIGWLTALLKPATRQPDWSDAAQAYNDWMATYQADLGDFIALHYTANDDAGPFWREAGPRSRRSALFQAFCDPQDWPEDAALRGMSGGLSANLILPVAAGLGLLDGKRSPNITEAQRTTARRMRVLHRDYAATALSHAQALQALTTPKEEMAFTRREMRHGAK